MTTFLAYSNMSDDIKDQVEDDSLSWTSSSSSINEDTTSGDETQGDPPARSKGVSFGEVRVRQHERVLKTRTSDLYAGLQLGWNFKGSERFPVDDYEKKKEEEHHETHRNKSFERIKVLKEYGYSVDEVLSVEDKKKRNLDLRNRGIAVPEDVDAGEKHKKGGFLKGLFSWNHQK